MATETLRAAVQIASKQTQIQEFELPEIPPDAGILRVLRAGICGADVPGYADATRLPRILGHENVGIIEKLGDLAAERWGVKVGDYVALEEYLPCGNCNLCRAGEYRACEGTNRMAGSLRYGSTTTTVWPGLWGGYSQFQYIHPRAVMHKVPANVPPRMAAMALPLGNGFQWAVLDGGASVGETVVVQGPGQQGLACVVAAKAAGARTVISTGLARDRQRLDVAKKLGADHTIAVDEESLARTRQGDHQRPRRRFGARRLVGRRDRGGQRRTRHPQGAPRAIHRGVVQTQADRRLRARHDHRQNDQLPRRARPQLQSGRDGSRIDGVRAGSISK